MRPLTTIPHSLSLSAHPDGAYLLDVTVAEVHCLSVIVLCTVACWPDFLPCAVWKGDAAEAAQIFLQRTICC